MMRFPGPLLLSVCCGSDAVSCKVFLSCTLGQEAKYQCCGRVYVLPSKLTLPRDPTSKFFSYTDNILRIKTACSFPFICCGSVCF